ncbi:hypothetical protein T492DRAFT_1016565 [Pavlovales sp. CCMP2436]|nr:hypothetical protein T492DRAFT_1016565 [Pavlovales sp. CCMP2436]
MGFLVSDLLQTAEPFLHLLCIDFKIGACVPFQQSTRLASGLYRCGDHTSAPTLNGAMESVIKASPYIRRRSPPPPTCPSPPSTAVATTRSTKR